MRDPVTIERVLDTFAASLQSAIVQHERAAESFRHVHMGLGLLSDKLRQGPGADKSGSVEPGGE